MTYPEFDDRIGKLQRLYNTILASIALDGEDIDICAEVESYIEDMHAHIKNQDIGYKQFYKMLVDGNKHYKALKTIQNHG